MSDSPSPVGPVKKDNVRNPFYELWDPSQPTMPTTVFQLSQAFVQNTKYFYYPFVFVLPTGDLFVWANTYGEIVQVRGQPACDSCHVCALLGSCCFCAPPAFPLC